ncbi:MAG: hypothetical protein AAFR58_00665 [Cyanobacteria bacterium J06627_28]
MSTSVLPRLMEVDSELTSQAAALEAQLTELKEKREGIQTVIAMFESGGSADLSAIAAVTGTTQKKSAGKKASTRTTKAKTTKTKATKAKATKAKTTKTKATKAKDTKTKATKTQAATKRKPATATKAKRGRPAKAAAAEKAPAATKVKAAKTTKATKKSGTAPKRSGRTANWQRYVQDSYSKSPLPDVIVGVLQAQPNNVFKIADVMNAVFKEDMPKNHFLKARNRISNILSAGARDGVWHRGRGGTYSMSEKSIKAG